MLDNALSYLHRPRDRDGLYRRHHPLAFPSRRLPELKIVRFPYKIGFYKLLGILEHKQNNSHTKLKLTKTIREH